MSFAKVTKALDGIEPAEVAYVGISASITIRLASVADWERVCDRIGITRGKRTTRVEHHHPNDQRTIYTGPVEPLVPLVQHIHWSWCTCLDQPEPDGIEQEGLPL